MPRIFAAQPANCGPIAAAFMAGGGTPAATEIRPTIAEGTAIAQPIRLQEVLGALRETRGGAVMLSEAEIGAATLDLARIGIYVEPTAAQASAAFAKLLAAGAITIEADHRAGDDRQRPEGNATHRGPVGSDTVMVTSGPRIALLGFSIECNRFAPVATETDFAGRTLMRGQTMMARRALRRPQMLGELPGFIADMDAAGAWEPVPILLAMAEPNGPVEQEFFDRMMAEWETDLRAAGQLDGVYCVLHGAGLHHWRS